MEQFFFSGWQSLLRTLVVGALAYITLIVHFSPSWPGISTDAGTPVFIGKN